MPRIKRTVTTGRHVIVVVVIRGIVMSAFAFDPCLSDILPLYKLDSWTGPSRRVTSNLSHFAVAAEDT
jgi:hypothetical protein